MKRDREIDESDENTNVKKIPVDNKKVMDNYDVDEYIKYVLGIDEFNKYGKPKCIRPVTKKFQAAVSSDNSGYLYIYI